MIRYIAQISRKIVLDLSQPSAVKQQLRVCRLAWQGMIYIYGIGLTNEWQAYPQKLTHW